MKTSIYLKIFLPLLALIIACNKEPEESFDREILVDSLWINNMAVANNGSITAIDYNNVNIRIKFQTRVDTTQFIRKKLFITGGIDTTYTYHFGTERQNLYLKLPAPLEGLTTYRLLFDQGNNLGGRIYESFSVVFNTSLDETPKFHQITDDSLLTLVQRKTFDYFWIHGHPVSGLARERYGSGDIVTSGGSGFGIMALIVGIERGFISRQQGLERLTTMVNFLAKSSTDRFHGAFPHWMNGSTGKVIPFGTKDNGGDLVETAFLMQGLLTAKQYFNSGPAEETALCDTIQKLWETVEWDWYRNGGQNKLFWHWSPNYGWEINMPVQGWNEALMVYVLAAASPTHPVPKTVYDQGWARDGAYPMINGNSFYNVLLPLGENYGGPMFFAHYSFLGLDPRNLNDQYANYWQQNVAHARINYEYCKTNPRNYPYYGSDCWGLTASDIPNSYSASSPTNDKGVIAPTAAIASIPYVPEAGMDALKFFYYVLGDRMWGQYGFYDAFSLKEQWFASSYIAIDQGPIVCMIENYRTGLLWDLFMTNHDITSGLTLLGFSY
ncbi:MAG: glucoamylase family protein [Bacteroidales bacterium]